MDSGKNLRWRRFLAPGASHSLLVPIDHGLTLGPLEGIESIAAMSRWIGHPAISGVIVHKGIAQRLGERGVLTGGGVMVHLNGMSALSASDRATAAALGRRVAETTVRWISGR